MTDQLPASASTRRNGLVALIVLLVIAGAALYVKGSRSGKETAVKGTSAAACATSTEKVAALSPLAKGEVAALAMAKDVEPMPALAFNGPDGKPLTLADFKGKTLLLNLWATWCVPCRSEMSALDRLQQASGSDRFEVVAINVDTSRLDKPKAFLNEIGVKSLNFYADPKADIFFQLKQTGGVLGLPATFLIDAAGCRIGMMAGPAAWDSADGKALIAAAARPETGL
jgi:thiol-disulfide isomerase/thioredoxin